MNIRKNDTDSFISERLVEFDTLPSTNEYCKADHIRGNRIVLAHCQSAGHGRGGRSFSSDEGGLYVSFCYKLDGVEAKKLLPVTGMCAVAVLRAIESVCGVTADIKWTNDLLLRGKKICGILAETVFDGSGKPGKLIIGIGININQSAESFEGELSDIASSILALTGKETDRYELLRVLAINIEAVYSAVCGEGANIVEYIEEYRRHCITLGREVHILRPGLAPVGVDVRKVFAETPNIFPIALAEDIDDTFGLCVRHMDGMTETLFSGEVSVR